MHLLAEFSAAAPALLPEWMDPTSLLQRLGGWALWGAAAIVFAECGLLIGFFLPGDSLLFTVGLFQHEGFVPHPLWFVCTVLSVAAFVGNVTGYEIGRKAGPAIFERPNSKIFKAKHIEQTAVFFEKHGARAIILARFVPIVRTFITVAAGAGRMSRRTFFLFSGVGAVLWATGVTCLGYALGSIPLIRNNIELGLLALVVLSLIPVGIEVLRARAKERKAGPQLPDQPRPQTVTPDRRP